VFSELSRKFDAKNGTFCPIIVNFGTVLVLRERSAPVKFREHCSSSFGLIEAQSSTLSGLIAGPPSGVSF